MDRYTKENNHVINTPSACCTMRYAAQPSGHDEMITAVADIQSPVPVAVMYSLSGSKCSRAVVYVSTKADAGSCALVQLAALLKIFSQTQHLLLRLS
jgi:hypothetical protein